MSHIEAENLNFSGESVDLHLRDGCSIGEGGERPARSEFVIPPEIRGPVIAGFDEIDPFAPGPFDDFFEVKRARWRDVRTDQPTRKADRLDLHFGLSARGEELQCYFAEPDEKALAGIGEGPQDETGGIGSDDRGRAREYFEVVQNDTYRFPLNSEPVRDFFSNLSPESIIHIHETYPDNHRTVREYLDENRSRIPFRARIAQTEFDRNDSDAPLVAGITAVPFVDPGDAIVEITAPKDLMPDPGDRGGADDLPVGSGLEFTALFENIPLSYLMHREADGVGNLTNDLFYGPRSLGRSLSRQRGGSDAVSTANSGRNAKVKETVNG